MSLVPAASLRAQFVTAATAKFAQNVPDFVALQTLVRENGGVFHNDHGAIRTADPAVAALFVRAARVLGLHRDLDYRFPAKKLVSFDLQAAGQDHRPFKIFLSQVDLEAFPVEVAALVREDCAEHCKHRPVRDQDIDEPRLGKTRCGFGWIRNGGAERRGGRL